MSLTEDKRYTSRNKYTNLIAANGKRVLVCTGPPFSFDDDKHLAEIVRSFDGKVIISGGSTAAIIARELERDVTVLLDRNRYGLPSMSEMDGISLVTEGILTLDSVRSRLSADRIEENTGAPDIRIIRMLLEHDEVVFLVGTSMSILHQLPYVPVKLPGRRETVEGIAELLRRKFSKNVSLFFL